MPWNDITRKQHNRDHPRYPSDLTDREWAVVAPLIPPAKSGGRPRTTDIREVVNAILYLAGSGSQWLALPKDFPPTSTVRGYFYCWRDIGLWQPINQILVAATRELEGREASPTAGVIDSQSVRTTESGGVCGYDAGRRIKGRKRHIITDTLGLILFVRTCPGRRHPGPGRRPRCPQSRPVPVPWLRHVFADGGYAGEKLRSALCGKPPAVVYWQPNEQNQPDRQVQRVA